MECNIMANKQKRLEVARNQVDDLILLLLSGSFTIRCPFFHTHAFQYVGKNQDANLPFLFLPYSPVDDEKGTLYITYHFIHSVSVFSHSSLFKWNFKLNNLRRCIYIGIFYKFLYRKWKIRQYIYTQYRRMLGFIYRWLTCVLLLFLLFQYTNRKLLQLRIT